MSSTRSMVAPGYRLGCSCGAGRFVVRLNGPGFIGAGRESFQHQVGSMMPSVTQPRLQRAGVAARDQTRGATFGKVGGAVDGAETGEQGALPDAAVSIGAENLAVIGARGQHFQERGADYGVLLRGGASRGADRRG